MLLGMWTAIAPLMKPWCAEGDVLPAANLNFLSGKVFVGTMSRCLGGEANCFGELWLPMHFSNGRISPVLKVQPARVGLANSELFIMDGQCQDELLHCTDDPWP